METVELTVHLPKENLEFAEQYARQHQMTVAELIARYIERLQAGVSAPIHPDIEAISGIVPSDINAKALYQEHLLRKHGQRSSSD